LERGVKYVTVSIPRAIADNIDHLIEALGYWPSRSSFVREACLEKIRVETRRLNELKEATGGAGRTRGGSNRERPRG
jgi:Arc/MetJ-type ribon-helix-helix transcriptional regulator